MSVITVLVILLIVYIATNRDECKLRTLITGKKLKWDWDDIRIYGILAALVVCLFASTGRPGPLNAP